MGNAIMINPPGGGGGKKLLFDWTCTDDDFDYVIPLSAYDIATQTWTTDGSVDLTQLPSAYKAVILPTDAFAEIDSIPTNGGFYSVCTKANSAWQPNFIVLSSMVVDATHIKHVDWSPTDLSKIDVSDYALYVMNNLDFYYSYLTAHNIGGYENYCIQTRLYRCCDSDVTFPALISDFNTPTTSNSIRSVIGYRYGSPLYLSLPPIADEWSATFEKTGAGWLGTIETTLISMTAVSYDTHSVRNDHYKTMFRTENIDWSKDFDLISKRGLLEKKITPGDTIRIWGWNN